MKLPRPFVRLPLRLPVQALQAELAALPAEAWRPHPQGFAGNDAVPLISHGGDPADDRPFGEMAETPWLRACPAMRAAATRATRRRSAGCSGSAARAFSGPIAGRSCSCSAAWMELTWLAQSKPASDARLTMLAPSASLGTRPSVSAFRPTRLTFSTTSAGAVGGTPAMLARPWMPAGSTRTSSLICAGSVRSTL